MTSGENSRRRSARAWLKASTTEPDRLARYIFPLEARFVAPEMVRLGSLHAGIELGEGGVTTVADMYYFEDDVARACDAIGLRGILG